MGFYRFPDITLDAKKGDLKSPDSNVVPVQVRPRAPNIVYSA